MRITPLCNDISSQLNTNICLYSHTSELIEHYNSSESFLNLFIIFPDILPYLFHQAETEYPIFSFINDYICYIHFTVTDGIYIIGPFHMLLSDENIHAQHTFITKAISPQYLSRIPLVHPAYALRYSLLLFNMYQDKDLSESKCCYQNFHTEIIYKQIKTQTIADIFSNRENQKMHNPYDQEIRLLKSIEDGDIEGLQRSQAEPTYGSLGTTAKDPVRNGKNMAIYMVTASGRAAIRGGLSAEYIFSLTDSYIQQIEALKNMLILQPLVEEAQLNFAQMVADLKRQRKHQSELEHPLIHQCKNYVFQHLHSKLTVQEIADALHVHPNFLSSLFHTREGIPLYQYILLQKIDLTKNLLIYSDYSYIDIANYLGFTSQSHLGSRFKAATGMTLKQYRNAYKKEEFY